MYQSYWAQTLQTFSYLHSVEDEASEEAYCFECSKLLLAARNATSELGAQSDWRNLLPRLETPVGTKRLKPVTDTENGFYVWRAVRAQLSSQPANMYIQGAGPNLTTVPPDAHQENLSRNDLSGVLHQQPEQLVFFACERQAAGIEEREFVGNIYFEMRVLVTGL